MGSGASVPGEMSEEDSTFKDYLGDNSKMEKLFADIAATSTQKKNGLQRVNVTNLLNYFNDRPDPFIKNILKNKNVVLSAMKFTSQQEANSQISKENFHRLLASIYLFSHIWDILGVVDEDHDKRVTRAEFAKAKDLCSSMKFLHIGNISDEEWNNKFNLLDPNHNGIISFYELCSYISRNVVNMETYFSDDPSSSSTETVAPSQVDEEDDKLGNHFCYVSASAAVAAWEAEQALRAAKEEEVKEKMLSMAGLIDHNSGRTHAIHFAVEKTEQAAKMAIEALENDNRDAAWRAASEAEHSTTIASSTVHSAVIDRTHSIMGLGGSGHVKPTEQEGNPIYHPTHMKGVHSDTHPTTTTPLNAFLLDNKKDSKGHAHSDKIILTNSSQDTNQFSVATKIPEKILENSELVVSPPKKLDPFVF